MKISNIVLLIAGLCIGLEIQHAYPQYDEETNPAASAPTYDDRYPLTVEEKAELTQLGAHRCSQTPSVCTPEEFAEFQRQVDALVDRYCALPDNAKYCKSPDVRRLFTMHLWFSSIPDDEYYKQIEEISQVTVQMRRKIEQAEADAAATKDDRYPLTAEEKAEIIQLGTHRCAQVPGPCTPEENAELQRQFDALVDRYCELPGNAKNCESPDARNFFKMHLWFSSIPDEEYRQITAEVSEWNAEVRRVNEQTDRELEEIQQDFDRRAEENKRFQQEEEARILAEYRAEQEKHAEEHAQRVAAYEEEKRVAELQRQWDENWKKVEEEELSAAVLQLQKEKETQLLARQQQEKEQMLARHEQEVVRDQEERRQWYEEGRIGEYDRYTETLLRTHEMELAWLGERHAHEWKFVHMSDQEMAELQKRAKALYAAAMLRVSATALGWDDRLEVASELISAVVKQLQMEQQLSRDGREPGQWEQ